MHQSLGIDAGLLPSHVRQEGPMLVDLLADARCEGNAGVNRQHDASEVEHKGTRRRRKRRSLDGEPEAIGDAAPANAQACLVPL